MALAIQILNGPQAKLTLPLYLGFTIGRKRGKLIVNDPKISSIHAKIEQTQDGSMFLVDLNSANGILYKQEKVKKINLSPGVTFLLGRTQFKIIEINEVQPPKPLEPPSDPVNKEVDKENHSLFRDILQKLALITKDPLSVHYPFIKPLKLEIISGFQLSRTWYLGYGPRQAGAKSIDIPIYEPNAPDLCFELVQLSNNMVFKTSYPDSVFLNKERHTSSIIKDGDVISIFSTNIKVSFLHD